MADLALPAADLFPFKYSILELNTAVKPFSYRHIFEHFSVDALLYIDPDIRVYEHLTHVWEALSHSDVVLTPHMFEPLEDSKSPSELNILQSGTYNLGFLGLRRGKTSEKLLKWWRKKLFSECVGCIPQTWFTSDTGHMVYTTAGKNGLGAGSTRPQSSSKNPRSKSIKLTSQILSATSRTPTTWPLNTILRLILR